MRKANVVVDDVFSLKTKQYYMNWLTGIRGSW